MPGARVDIRNVWKSFELGGRVIEVLRGVDLVLQPGQMVAVVGSSGAGKSTLLHVLGALDRPTSGAIAYDGVDLSGRSATELAEFRNRTIGFVFQFHHLLPDFTALENCAMPALIARMPRAEALGRAQALLERVGLKDRLEHRPGELSGGEQQRVALARALVLEPRVLLADEPTGNLDSKTGEEIHRLVVELNRERGMTMLVVTHNADLASRMPERLHMIDGRLERVAATGSDGKPAALPAADSLSSTERRPSEGEIVAARKHAAARRDDSNRDLGYGAVFLFLGLLLTIGSYALAVGAGGGKYVVTTGLIAVGIGRILRGLFRRGSGR